MFESSDQSAGRISRRTALQKGGIALGSSIIGVSSISGTADAEPTKIDEYSGISEPGKYVLTDDLTTTGNCLGIGASNVTIDGNGHTISGDGSGIGISIGSSKGV